MTAAQSGAEEIRESVEAAGAERLRGPVDLEVDGAGPCPVTPLGRQGDVHYFLSPSGNLVARKPREFSRNELAVLFDGDMGWPFSAFPKKDGDGFVVDWNINKLAGWLILKCAECGYFDPERQVRGPGVWRAEKETGEVDPRLLVHCGDQLSSDGGRTWRPAGCRIGRHVYVAGLPEPRPALGEGVGAARALYDLLRQWNWRDDHAPDLLFGWIAAAMIAGALPWRPIVWVTGQAGTGKSTLERLLDRLLSGLALRAADPTSAGLRQTLKGAARVVMLDEIEASPRNNRARDVVELARMGSTAGQAAVLRGSADGKAQSYPIEAIFYLTSIIPPPLEPQDASRIAVLDLMPLDSDPAHRVKVTQAIRDLAGIGPALRGRMLDGIERYRANFDVWESALAGAGCDSRSIDQLATLLAAGDTLRQDAVTDPSAASGQLDAMQGEIESEDRISDADKCVNHLLSSPISLMQGGRFITYAEAVAQAIGTTGDRETASRALLAHGVRAEFVDGMAQVTVANNHRALLRVYEDTPWTGGGWKTSLARLAMAEKLGPSKFAGVTSRATRFFLEIEPAGGPEPPPPDEDL